MPEIADYLARAVEAERNAKTAMSADTRDRYRAMAAEWRELAEAVKRGEAKPVKFH